MCRTASVTTVLRGAAIVLLLSAVIIPVSVSAASGPRICNQTNEVVYLATAWEQGWSGIHVEGWFTFKPGECWYVFSHREGSLFGDTHDRYYYANNAAGTKAWKGNDPKRSYCVHPTEKFFIAQPSGDCPTGFERRNFRPVPDNGINLAP